jgi:hypothetical protein
MNQIAQKINQFYSTLGTVCPKYKNISVTADDLKDDDVLSEVLYDLEDNAYAYEGATELYRDIVRRTNKKRQICNVIGVIGAIVIALGFFLMVGTEGASYLDNIPLSQIIVQSIIGLAIMAFGFITLVIAKKLEA